MQICGIEREPAARCRIEAGNSCVAIMWRTYTTLPILVHCLILPASHNTNVHRGGPIPCNFQIDTDFYYRLFVMMQRFVQKCTILPFHIKELWYPTQTYLKTWSDLILMISELIIRECPCQTGLHKLWYPSIRDTSKWSKFGAHGEHGDVFLFSNLGALWFSANLFRYSLHVCLREVKNNFSPKHSYLRHFLWRF